MSQQLPQHQYQPAIVHPQAAQQHQPQKATTKQVTQPQFHSQPQSPQAGGQPQMPRQQNLQPPHLQGQTLGEQQVARQHLHHHLQHQNLSPPQQVEEPNRIMTQSNCSNRFMEADAAQVSSTFEEW